MNRTLSILATGIVCAFAISGPAGRAQQSFYQQFRGNNASMSEVQPSWMGPLIQSDSRLTQAVRFAVSQADFSGTHTINYGNGKGISTIVHRRFQFEVDPPSFFRNHSTTQKDGFGNAGVQVKMRLASGNAAHGNFAVSAVLYHAFAPRVEQNLMLSEYYIPSIAAGKAFGRFAFLGTVGGLLPTSKISLQGRAVEWNTTAQMHVAKYAWVDIEDNSIFFHAGPLDGKTQNMITPAAFYMVRRKEWRPDHAAVVFATGMQIATSGYHFVNHNLITEMRLVF